MIGAPIPGPQRRVLFIANGNGEDSIAAAIIKALPANVRAEAYPMIGHGRAYEDLCPIVGPRAHVPSEGWRHTRGGLMRDVRGGVLLKIPGAIGFLAQARGQYDRVVAIGDAVPLLLCRLAGLSVDIYLDVFKSGYAHKYTAAERLLIKATAKKTYCRDDMLAARLRRSRIHAMSAGNIMTDTVPRGTYDMTRKRRFPLAVTLMPGSREWTAKSLRTQLEALRRMPLALKPDIFVAVANGIDVTQLASDVGLTHVPPARARPNDLGRFTGDNMVVHLARGAVGELIEASDLVLSQAGTGTQQALGLGKPVVTFDRAENRRKRMRDEQALMGEARILTAPDAKAIADAVLQLLADKAERQRLGLIGRQRLGGPGTLASVVADLSS